MSGGTIKGGNVQIGQDGTASNNFTIYQPAVADGTSRWAVGVAGATTKDMITVSGSNITLGGNLVQAATAAPAFSAYNAGTQSVSANTDTKMIFNAENFDTANCFDSTTNYRFTPNVAGYYQLNASVYESGFAGSLYFLALRKNGTNIQELYRTTVTGQATFNGSTIVYANGTTDYFELYTYSSGGTMTLGANDSRYMTFNGAMIRSA